MFQKSYTFASLNSCDCKTSDFGLWCNGNTTDSGPVFLGSNPSSPTRKGSLHGGDSILSLFGLWCNGNTTDSGPVFLGSNPSSPTRKGVVFSR